MLDEGADHGQPMNWFGTIKNSPDCLLGQGCKTRKNFNFLKKGKIVILVKIQNFYRSRMTKQTSLLESSCEI